MLGWIIIVTRQKDGTKPATGEYDGTDKVAKWNADVSGLNWIEELVSQDKVVCLSRNLYPSLYSVQLKDILPVISGGEPPYVMWENDWENDNLIVRARPEFTLQDKEIHTGNPDEWLLITVYDMS